MPRFGVRKLNGGQECSEMSGTGFCVDIQVYIRIDVHNKRGQNI